MAVTINYPELKQRTFSSEFVRKWVERIYGYPVHPATWRNWRKWAGANKQTYFFDQVCFMSAIAFIRRSDRIKGFSPTRELWRHDIEAVANSVEIQEPLAEMVKFLDAHEQVEGRYAAQVLGVHRSTLYEAIPNFSTRKIYSLSELRQQLKDRSKKKAS